MREQLLAVDYQELTGDAQLLSQDSDLGGKPRDFTPQFGGIFWLDHAEIMGPRQRKNAAPRTT